MTHEIDNPDVALAILDGTHEMVKKLFGEDVELIMIHTKKEENQTYVGISSSMELEDLVTTLRMAATQSRDQLIQRTKIEPERENGRQKTRPNTTISGRKNPQG